MVGCLLNATVATAIRSHVQILESGHFLFSLRGKGPEQALCKPCGGHAKANF
ncbi:hypothetical protein ApDm4_0393 [Acetobacter pomorum]|nr:hypothetical protein ApDm4_0393 [Acetobacter pomorum]